MKRESRIGLTVVVFVVDFAATVVVVVGFSVVVVMGLVFVAVVGESVVVVVAVVSSCFHANQNEITTKLQNNNQTLYNINVGDKHQVSMI